MDTLETRDQETASAARGVNHDVLTRHLTKVSHESRDVPGGEILADCVTSGVAEESLVELAEVIMGKGRRDYV